VTGGAGDGPVVREDERGEEGKGREREGASEAVVVENRCPKLLARRESIDAAESCTPCKDRPSMLQSHAHPVRIVRLFCRVMHPLLMTSRGRCTVAEAFEAR
jgi:hypothetical protein